MTNTTLVRVALQSNGIGPAGGRALVTALAKNTTLMALDLRGNDGIHGDSIRTSARDSTFPSIFGESCPKACRSLAAIKEYSKFGISKIFATVKGDTVRNTKSRRLQKQNSLTVNWALSVDIRNAVMSYSTLSFCLFLSIADSCIAVKRRVSQNRIDPINSENLDLLGKNIASDN